MRTLTRHIVREIAVPAALALVVVTFIAVASRVHAQTRDVSLAYATPLDMARLVLYLLPTLVSYVIAITYMMGLLLAFGRLSQDGEIVAIQAAGIPLKRVVGPVVACGAVLSVVCFGLQDQVQPWAARRMVDLLGRQLAERRGLDVLPAGLMHEFQDWRVYIARRDPDGTWRDVEILDGQGWAYYAGAAQLVDGDDEAFLVLRDGYILMPDPGGRLALSSFDRWEVRVPEVAPGEVSVGNMALSLRQMLSLERRLTRELEAGEAVGLRSRLRDLRQDIGERLSLPFACIAVTLVAAPLGVRARRSGRSYSFAVGFSVVLAYYVLQMLAQSRSLHGFGEVMARAQAPNVALALLGAWLLWRVDRV